MSLRLRLTLVYTGLLGCAIILLSIVIHAMVSAVMLNQVDIRLEALSDQIIETLQADAHHRLETNTIPLIFSQDIYYQVRSAEGEIVLFSENAHPLNGALDETAIAQNQTVFRDVNGDPLRLRVMTVPLMAGGEDSGWLQVGESIHELLHGQRFLLIVFSAAAIFAIIMVGVVGWLFTGQALEPLETMAQITNRITSTNDLSQRIPLSAGQSNEFTALALTFNQTLVRLERLFNAQRRFLADVSHELRTPLTVIKGNVGLMRMVTTYDKESLNSIDSEVDRLTRLVGDLLLMAQAETGKLPLMLETVHIETLLVEVYEEMKVLSEGAHDIQMDNISPATITGDRDRLKQVLLNLASNAINYSSVNDRIILSMSISDDWVKIILSDEGMGIPDEELSRLFERFYRGDKSRTRTGKNVGFGLGLPIAYWIVRNHGGRIDVETEVDRGTTFTVWLPRSQAEIPTRPSKKAI